MINCCLHRTFRRITELDPSERAGYYNQFSKNARGSRGKGRVSGRGTGDNAMETVSGGYISSRKGRGRGKGKSGRGYGKRHFFRGRGRKTK